MMATKCQADLARNRNPNERRPLRFVREMSARSGRVQDLVGCPFCGEDVLTYRWSRCGGGKRCACGALLCNSIALSAPPRGKGMKMAKCKRTRLPDRQGVRTVLDFNKIPYDVLSTVAVVVARTCSEKKKQVVRRLVRVYGAAR